MAKLTVIGRKGASFTASAEQDTEIINAPFKNKLGVILFSFIWMIRERKNRQYNIILTEPSKLCICGLFGKIFYRCKWIVDVWDIPFRCISKSFIVRIKTAFDRKVAGILFKYADRFILSIIPDFEFAQFNVPQDKVVQLKNAIWLREKPFFVEKPQEKNDKKQILCMRTFFYPDCGLDTLAEAFQILNNQIDNVELTIVGKIIKSVEPQVSSLRGLSNIHFYDFIEHEKLMNMISQSSACVIPYHDSPDQSQIFPIKVLEYLSMNAVVVAARLPGISSMITDGRNGLLFQPGNTVELASKLIWVFNNKELANQISINAGDIEIEHDCVYKAKKILEIMNEISGIELKEIQVAQQVI